ncbi:MAG TPA: fumarylacetoacetate hydrolase family protein [Steroidobacteraceae bacterium]|jgi:fumarylpyruvate hydrolase|nr:fumarylacetoacetate hydrolase family protein [Steroidobacteraceae bacterium]
MSYVIPAPVVPTVAVKGTNDRFPVRRIFCVGRNYAAHAREMGNDDREPPFFFTKPADAVVANDSSVPYPSRTANFHHEVELVVALGGGGTNVAKADASALIYGYAVGIDLTRRDLQSVFKDRGQPWDASKGFDKSAPLAAIHPRKDVGLIETGGIWLTVNGKERQRADLAEMTWKVPEIISELSTLFELAPGDLIFTGTPAGVGPLVRGDVVEAGIDGLTPLTIRIV